MKFRVDGPYVRDTDNGDAIQRFAGLSAFALFKRFLMPNGWHALVEPNLVEYRDIANEAGWTGPIVLRVFRCAAPPNAFALDPWSYTAAQAQEFTLRLLEKGFLVDWTGGDFRLCFPNDGSPDGPRGVNEHTNQFTAPLVGVPYIFNSRNEPNLNMNGGNPPPPPPWVSPVWYSGVYYGGAWDPSTNGSVINLHTDRGDEGGIHKWVGKAHESAPFLWPNNLPIWYDEPMGADEVTIPGRRSSVAPYFGVLGSVLSMVTAVYFHSTAGLSCDRYPPITRACAVEFFRGAAGALKHSQAVQS